MIPETLGHYRILRSLGAGGMGQVYLADDTTLHRKVALKVLLGDVAADPERQERFRREARAVAALSHPNIVTIHSVEEDGGRLFLTMEYVDGKPLTGLIPRDGMPLDKLLAIAIPLADAVAAAHQGGITHRDLKPGNVMVAADGRVKVLDFGLARLQQPDVPEAATMTAPLTGEGRILGTVAYMSPEQAEGRPLDPRSDLFSLGILLYEMATGRRPFTGDTSMSIISAILRDAPPPISGIRPDVPRELGRIIKRALQKDPEQRYQTAKDLRNDLQLLKQDLDSGELAAGGPSAQRPRRRSASLWWALGAAAIVLVIVGTALARFGARPAPAATPLFARFDVRKLTTDGNVVTFAISPDGTYAAYAVRDNDGQTLRMRQLATDADTIIVPRQSVTFSGLEFSHDAQYLYYVAGHGTGFFARRARGRLYRVPSLGGSSTGLVDDVWGSFSLSPDEARVAFFRFTEGGDGRLMRSNLDGSDAKVLATRTQPQRFISSSPAWSPDGRTIAAGFWGGERVEAGLVTVPADGGAEQVLPTDQKWGAIDQIAWAPDGSGIFLSAAHPSSTWSFQIWFASYTDGRARRITNDANNYLNVSVSRDARSLLILDSAWVSGIWVGLPGHSAGLSPVGSPGDGFCGVAWSADNRIVFGTRDFDVGVMDADGVNRRILTVDEHNNRFPAVSMDGRYLFFRSWRKPGASIWRMNRDGGEARALNEDEGEDPAVSPDGKWVFYRSSAGGKESIQKVSSDGGTAELVTDQISSVAVSRDGRSLAGVRVGSGGRPGVNVLPFGGGNPIRTFDAPSEVTAIIDVRWTSDGKTLVYTGDVREVGNIWMQSLTGAAPTKVTDFTAEAIWSFDIATDGRLVLARGHQNNNMLQISAVK